MFIYICFFSVGMSATVWTVNTEIYPIHLIGTAGSLSSATNWLSNFAVSATFLSILSTAQGRVVAFLMLGCFTVSCWMFTFLLLPETKGIPVQVNVDTILKK